MNNLGRVATISVSAVLVGAYTYGTAFDLDRTGILGGILYGTALEWAVFLLPVLTVALVNRWWALSVALVPFALLLYVHSATDYAYPYHEDPYPVIAVMGTVFLLGISSLGFLLRAVVDRSISEHGFRGIREKLASK